MSLTITRGPLHVALAPTKDPVNHREGNIAIDHRNGRTSIRNSTSGAPFVTVDWEARTISVDTLNVPHVDVAKQQAAAEKKQAAPPVAPVAGPGPAVVKKKDKGDTL